MEFCKGGYETPSVAFQAGEMEEPFEFPYNGCVIDSQKLEVEVNRGDQVMIDIQYSLDNTVSIDSSGWVGCTEDGDPTYCFSVPNFALNMYKL